MKRHSMLMLRLLESIRNTFSTRKLLQKFGYDIHRLEKDDSPIVDPGIAKISPILHCDAMVRFLVLDPEDAIQRFHVNGQFYEQDVLDLISHHVHPDRGCFVDIGANVGNHAIFAASQLGFRHVIAFEPMRRQHTILTFNTLLNNLASTVQIHKLALSNREGLARMITPNPDNIGRSMISQTVYGEWVRLARGDDILVDKPVDFIKIDVEGHEMEALAGLSKTIGRWRPSMLIEVDDKNRELFSQWLLYHRYVCHEILRHHTSNAEVLILPECDLDIVSTLDT